MSGLRHSSPWFLWPIALVWDLAAFVLQMTGRLIGGVLGLVLIGAGVALTLTIAAAPIGIPLAILGSLLLVRVVF